MLSASSHQDNVTKINNSLDALLWDTWDKQDEWVSHVILTSWKTCGCSTLVMYNLQFVICLDVPLYTSWNMFWTWERVQVCFAHQFSSISRILNLWIDVWLNNNLILIIDLKKKKKATKKPYLRAGKIFFNVNTELRNPPSSGAELSAELSPSELPDAVALLTFFFVAFFFSDPLPCLTFFLPLVPPTVHYTKGMKM